MNNHDFPVVVLISGRGSNLGALIRSASNYKVVAVISNKANAAGLKIARDAGIDALSFERDDFPSLLAQKEAIYGAIRRHNPALVALAGYMQIISPEFASEYQGRLINIHPALLPALPGLDTHRRALEAGLKEHGCSVHLVDAGVDTGSIIAQAALEVAPGESEEELAARVLALEHRLYPWVLNNIAVRAISIAGGNISCSAACREDALQKGFRGAPASLPAL